MMIKMMKYVVATTLFATSTVLSASTPRRKNNENQDGRNLRFGMGLGSAAVSTGKKTGKTGAGDGYQQGMGMGWGMEGGYGKKGMGKANYPQGMASKRTGTGFGKGMGGKKGKGKGKGFQDDPEALGISFSVLNAAQDVTPCDSTALGNAMATLENNRFCIFLSYSGLSSSESASNIRGPAELNAEADVLFTLSSGTSKNDCFDLSAEDISDLYDGLLYFNIETPACPEGEIRGQIVV